MKIKNLLAVLAMVAMWGCAELSQRPFEPEKITKRSTVSPELDYSNEIPDCKTAGTRIAEHIEIGMTLDDVRRLVGKPGWKLPGSWWWESAFSEKGRPVIKFPFGASDGDIVITGLSSDVTRCGDSKTQAEHNRYD